MTKQLKEAEEILKSYQKRFSIPTDDIEEYFDKTVKNIRARLCCFTKYTINNLNKWISQHTSSNVEDGKIIGTIAILS